MTDAKEQTLRIRNGRAVDLELHLEPWGDQIILAPGASVDLVARGPGEGRLEVESGEGRVIVFGWIGSVVTMMYEGRELASGQRVG